MYAQQGRYQDAEAAWRVVLQTDPNHHGAAAALAKTRTLRATPQRVTQAERGSAARWGAVGLVGGMVVALLVASIVQSSQLRTSLHGYAQELTALRGSIDALSARQQAPDGCRATTPR